MSSVVRLLQGDVGDRGRYSCDDGENGSVKYAGGRGGTGGDVMGRIEEREGDEDVGDTGIFEGVAVGGFEMYEDEG